MFSNPGGKLKVLVIITLIVQTIGGGILGSQLIQSAEFLSMLISDRYLIRDLMDNTVLGFIAGAVITFLGGYVNSLLVFAFADLVENTAKIHNNLYVIGSDITKGKPE